MSLAAGGVRAETHVTVMLADGQPLMGELHPGAGVGELRLERSGEAPLTIKREEILAIDFGHARAEASPITVTLHTGDRLAGAVTFGPGSSIMVKRAGSPLRVPLAAVATVRLTREASLPAAGGSDTLVLGNGDRLEGKLEGAEGGKIVIRSAVGRVPVDVKRVVGVVMAKRDAVAPDTGIQVALDLTAGERLSGKWLSFSEEQVGLEAPGLGAVTVPLASIGQLVVQNGRVMLLSDLRPVEVKQVAYLDSEHPYRLNQSQGGRPLQLGGIKYSHGLGVHSRSELTYELGGKFKRFTATVGIDDEVGDAGSVVFRVWGDEKVLFESAVMHGGDAPRPVEIDLSGVLLLRLEVDYADDGDLADHADWANARLHR